MTKRSLFLAVTLVVTVAVSCLAQQMPQGTIVAPPSTLNRAVGQVHTPLYVFIPVNNVESGMNGETPASIACIYGLTSPTPGCPRTASQVPTGGTKAIAVIEQGRSPNMQADLATFSSQFGLGGNTSIIEICTPGPPPCPSNAGTGWDLETALDVQYAHAMAPNAQIVVAEFTNDPLRDGAEQQAAQYLADNYGGGEVSNSWGYNGGESWCGNGNCELAWDWYFQQSGVVFFASSGDYGLGTQYPSVSPNVVSAGGTSIQRDSDGNFTGESCWSGSGGGISQYEPLQQYELFVANKTGTKRGTPDWAAVADPTTGVDVYSSTYCHGWCTVGGTSAASPILAGIVNQAGGFSGSTPRELAKTYQYYGNPVGYHTRFYDVTSGSNGSPAGPGWDQCTGLGSIREPLGF